MRAGRTSITAEWVAWFRSVYGASSEYAPDEIGGALLARPLRLLARACRAAVVRQPAFLKLVSLVGLGLPEGVALRTLRLDDLVAKAVDEGATQLLLLGAGLDVRAFRLDGLDEVTVFEVDHPDTQRVKRRRLGDRAPRARELRFVSVDFERQDLETELTKAGFSTTEKSVVVWEGVTMYLHPEARRATLAALGRLLAPGSFVGISYIRPSTRGTPLERVQNVPLVLLGEPLLGPVESEAFADELRTAGFEVYEDDDAHGWARRYLGRDGPRPWERILVALRLALLACTRLVPLGCLRSGAKKARKC
jgi:methyltransferase (TIGR00027 family)